MKQYLLAVHMVEGEEPPEPETMQQGYQAVEAFNTQLQAEGAWVFAGGLHPPTAATVVRVRDGEVVTTDGPFAQTKEHLVASGLSGLPTWMPRWAGPARRLIRQRHFRDLDLLNQGRSYRRSRASMEDLPKIYVGVSS